MIMTPVDMAKAFFDQTGRRGEFDRNGLRFSRPLAHPAGTMDDS